MLEHWQLVKTLLTIRSLHNNIPCAVAVLVNIPPLMFQLHVAVMLSPIVALTVLLLTYILFMRVAVTSDPSMSVAVGSASMAH